LLKKKLFYLVFFTCQKNTPFNLYFDILSGVQDKVISNKITLYPLFFKYFFTLKTNEHLLFKADPPCFPLLPYLYQLNHNYELRINR